ncbi:MAG: response regulator [Lachnospiraceae bacterium]|nr:response regulator [Lachnospiraceae bacterium]
MMKRNSLKNGIIIVFLAMIMAGSFWHVNASGDDMPQNETGAGRLIGGGYAATSQISGVYFLPVLYDATNKLPTSEANYILSASNGYIWIGSNSGVIKYDGVNFTKLPSTGGLTSGRGLFEDSKGRIWVATRDNGVVVIDGQKTANFTKNEGLASNSARTFAEDPAGNVFIGSTAGISYVDAAFSVDAADSTDADISKYLHLIDDANINNERILRLVSDSNGVIYGHTSTGEVFTVSTGGISRFYKSTQLGIKKITTILADPENPGKLWFGTNGKYVFYGTFGDTVSNMNKIATDPAENIHWLDYACGRLWVSSVNIAGYVDENDQFVPFESIPIKDSFEMMTHDHQGNMWFASSRYGVMKLVADNFLDITGAAGLDAGTVNAVCKRKNDLYLGTDHGLYIIDQDYRQKQNYATEYFSGCRIRCIMNDNKGNMWFSVFSGGLGLVRLGQDMSLINYDINYGLPSNEIRCTYSMDDGSVIVGTSAGVALLNSSSVTNVYGSATGLKNTVILSVCEGYNEDIYAGTDGDGLYILKGDTFRRIGMEDGLGSDVVVRVKKDEKNGVFWVITSNSVEYFRNGSRNTVKSLPEDDYIDVIPDGEKNLWFISSQGVYVVEAEAVLNDTVNESGYRFYDRSNGLTSLPVSYSYSYIDDDGMLYIVGQGGVSVVDTRARYDFSGHTMIEMGSILVDGELLLPEDDGTTYKLPAKSGRLLITPAILDYTLTNPLVKVYLEGWDDSAEPVSQNNMSSYSVVGLDPGNYILHVQILDNQTKEVVSQREYKIIKEPTFFEQITVKVFLMILAIVAIGVIVWRVMTGTVIRKQYAQIEEARNEAEKANTAKSRFLANMSHEIRTPINTIMGMDEMILRENTKNVPREYSGPVTNYAHNIKYASESLLSLINDILDISKIESGKAHLVEQEYDAEELLRGIASMIRGRAEDKKLYFDLDIDESLPKRLYGDGGKIKQIILNILTNAVKYTDEGGFTLSVKVTDRNEAGVALRITVKDTGIGIRSEDIDKLFSAYERLDEVKNSNIQGTGLGLDISKQFTEMMGGKLWCESVYGEGSEFILTIRQKIADSTGIGVFLEKADESSGSVYKPQFIAPDADVLVVDDNPMNLSVIKGLLKPTKIFVTTAASGEECLEKIAVNNFNVVLLDHMMPGMDGIETLEKIRIDHPDLPVYALTANATAGGEEFYISKGFNGYLTKPIDIVAVEHAIMKHLPENIMSRPSEEDVVVEDNTLSEDMSWLEGTEGISVEDGIRNSGGASQFIFSLNMFHDSIDENSDVIEKAYRQDDIKLATVKVHALKSSARIIGALKLSEDCQAMEDAGNRKDTEYINAHMDKLLSDYREYKNILSKLDADEGSEEDKPEIPENELKDAYSALKDCIGQMDYDAVEMILSQLKEYKLQKSDEEIVQTLEKDLKLVKWEEMEEVIRNV